MGPQTLYTLLRKRYRLNRPHYITLVSSDLKTIPSIPLVALLAAWCLVKRMGNAKINIALNKTPLLETAYDHLNSELRDRNGTGAQGSFTHTPYVYTIDPHHHLLNRVGGENKLPVHRIILVGALVRTVGGPSHNFWQQTCLSASVTNIFAVCLQSD